MSDHEHPEKNWHLATLAIRAGHTRTHEGEHSEPIFPTSSFVFNNAAQAAARFSETEKGNIYSRFTNPTVRNFEERLAAMEGGDVCVGTASGMSAILSLCMAVLKAGDHVVCSESVFGTTIGLLTRYLGKFGVETTYVRLDDLDAWRNARKPNTKLFFLETPSNPLSAIADMKAIAAIAHERDIVFAVDNCFCTPALQKPFLFGADVIIHSATKFLDGQGRCMGGAIVGGGDVASRELVGKDVWNFLRTCGPSMSPFNAWVFLKGLETLELRMHAHSNAALQLATWLEHQPKVKKVHYAGLNSHPQHALAAKQQKGFGGIIALEVEGGREGAWQFVDATKLMSITANLGDVKTTLTHPCTTTHARITKEERERAGIVEGLLRISVGLEDLHDIKDDIQRALAAINTL